MFKGSDFIQIGLNDDPDEVFNFWRENSNIHAKWGTRKTWIFAPKINIRSRNVIFAFLKNIWIFAPKYFIIFRKIMRMWLYFTKMVQFMTVTWKSIQVHKNPWICTKLLNFSEVVIQDEQDDIKNLRILQNNPDSKEVSFERKLDTGDSSDVNLQDIRQVFVFTQHENHLEFKKDLDMFELDHDMNQYTGRTFFFCPNFLWCSFCRWISILMLFLNSYGFLILQDIERSFLSVALWRKNMPNFS